MSEQEIEQHAINLIKGISGVSIDTLEKAFSEIDEYTLWRQKKKSGSGYRLIAEPSENLKKFQRGLLKTLLRLQRRRDYYAREYRDKEIPLEISAQELCANISFAQHGGLRKKSTSTLIREHAWLNSYFVIKIDLKQAFPHAKSEMVQKLFQDLLHEEVSFLEKAMRFRKMTDKTIPTESEHKVFARLRLGNEIKRQYPKYTILPTKRVPNFRKLLRDLNKNEIGFNTPEIAEIISRASLYLTGLVTRADSIPQGAPSSGVILNILLARTDLFQFLKGVFPFSVVTVYTDDIIISTMNRPSVDQIRIMVEKMKSIGFPYNPKKLYVYDLRNASAYILGMKLTRRITPENEILIKRNSPGFKHPRGFARANRIEKDWYATHATLPKSVQKKYRSCFHKVCTTSDWGEDFFNKVLGYHGHIVTTYGWPTSFMPASLKNVVQQFRDKFRFKNNLLLLGDNPEKREWNNETKTVPRKRSELVEIFRQYQHNEIERIRKEVEEFRKSKKKK